MVQDEFPWKTPTALFTDLYELTMAQVYFEEGKNEEAVFDLFVREREGKRGYFVSAGAELVARFIMNFRFRKEDINYLRSLGKFSESFLKYLAELEFEGDIWIVPEGRVVLPGEILLEVRAPLIQAQILETALMNLVHLPTLVATKSARCRWSAGKGKILVDFGARRAQSPQSALFAARSSFIAGFDGTSLLEAGKLYSIPVYGTMAHSFVMLWEKEEEAFETFVKHWKGTILLVDTYNTAEGVRKAVAVARRMRQKGVTVSGVRIDSGNLVEEVKKVKKILDEENENMIIFLSGGLNEYEIEKIVKEAPYVAGFGVGSELVVSADKPYLDCAYKLVEYAGKPKIKLSEGKKTIPSRKKLLRVFRNGKIAGGVMALPDEDVSEFIGREFGQNSHSEDISYFIVRKGKVVQEFAERISSPEHYIRECRERFERDFEMLPPSVKDINSPEFLDVKVSPRLSEIQLACESIYKR